MAPVFRGHFLLRFFLAGGADLPFPMSAKEARPFDSAQGRLWGTHMRRGNLVFVTDRRGMN